MGKIKKWKLDRRKNAKLGSLSSATKRKIKSETEIPEIMISRIKFMLNSIFDFNNKYCNHVRIGSSNAYRLLSGSLTAKRVHHAENMKGAHNIGNLWEDFFEHQSFITFESGENVNYRVIRSQPFAYSVECPIFVATPDFYVQIDKGNKSPEYALVEIKSTNRTSNFESYSSQSFHEQIMQVQIALQCANVRKGYLIFYHGDEPEPQHCEEIEWRIIEVERKVNFFWQNQDKIIEGFSKYIASCVTFPKDATQLIQDYTKKELVKIKSHIFQKYSIKERNKSKHNFCEKKPVRTYCKISNEIRRNWMAGKGKKVPVGRPRLPYKMLKKKKERVLKYIYTLIRNM